MKVLVGSDGSTITLFLLTEGGPIPVLTLTKEEALEVVRMIQGLVGEAKVYRGTPQPDPIDLTKPTPTVPNAPLPPFPHPYEVVPNVPKWQPYDPNNVWRKFKPVCTFQEMGNTNPPDDEPPTVQYTNPCYSD